MTYHKEEAQLRCISEGEMNFVFSVRSHWAMIATWSRSYMFSVATELENIDLVGQRLYNMPRNIYNIFILIFQEPEARRVLDLLSLFIINIQQTILAQKNEEQESVNTGITNVYRSAYDLSVYLNEINPFWSATQARNLLEGYVYYLFEESTALFSGNYIRDLEAFERLISQAILTGHFIANGLIQYFNFTTVATRQ